MNTHLKSYCFLFFLLLFVSCNASSKKKTNEQQAPEQAPQTVQAEDTTVIIKDLLYANQLQYSQQEEIDLSNVFIPRFALINSDGSKVIYHHHEGEITQSMGEKYTHAVFGNQVFPLYFEAMQSESPKSHGIAINMNFEKLKGVVYGISQGNLYSQAVASINPWVSTGLDVLLIDEVYLNNLEIIDVKAIDPFPEDEEAVPEYNIPTEEKAYFERLYNSPLREIKLIAQGDNIKFYQMLLTSDDMEDLCVIALKTDDKTVCLEEIDEDGEFWMEYFGPIIISTMKKDDIFQCIMFVKTEEGSHSVLLEEKDGKLEYSSRIKTSRMTPFYNEEFDEED